MKAIAFVDTINHPLGAGGVEPQIAVSLWARARLFGSHSLISLRTVVPILLHL